MSEPMEKEKLGTALARWEPMIVPMLPEGVSAQRMLQAALLCATIDKTGALAKCTPKSIALGVARIAQWGLEPGITAHLVPYGDTATPVPDYKGLIQLMRESGALDVDAQVVREGDVFTFELGLHPQLRHVPQMKRGQITHAYAIVRLPRGVHKFEVMDIAEVEAIRSKHSKQWKSGPMPEWYARKTVIRRVAKYLPTMSRKLAAVLEQDNEDIPEAEIEPLSGDIRPIELPVRAPDVSPVDHSAIESEFGIATTTTPHRQYDPSVEYHPEDIA